VKLRLDPLTRQQRRALVCQALEVERLPPAVSTELDGLTMLTPGDVAAALRRSQTLGLDGDAAALVAALAEEEGFKPGSRRARLGFGATR
jgi:hypothetical protein